MEVELNGFDETGIVGRDLRFVRIGIRLENRLRPLVYNLLHFGSVTATKTWLKGLDDDRKTKYVRMILSDPAVDVSHYVFQTDHQIDVLRQFSLLEAKKLFSKRGELILGGLGGDDEGMKEEMWEMVTFLKRYERSPYWMESFVKSYGFRMVMEDLAKSSKILKDTSIDDYRVESYVDGGFPFVFWWRTFLEGAEVLGSRFSTRRTPIYGVTKGDEYYPVTSMAGNVATILNTVPGMIYPHATKEVPEMPLSNLNSFYSEFAERTSVPTFHRRVLFFGRIERDLQYLVPLILHEREGRRAIYEPFRLQYREGGTFRQFYRAFGYYPQNDTVIKGNIVTDSDRSILSDCEDEGLDTFDLSSILPDFAELMDEIADEAEESNLDTGYIEKVKARTEKSKQRAIDEHQNG